MSNLRETLRDLAEKPSENYEETLAQYRLWLDIGSVHGHIIVQDQVDEDIERIARPKSLLLTNDPIHPTAHLLIRLIGDIEADQKTSGHDLELHRRHCATTLNRFFEENLYYARSLDRAKPVTFLTNTNLIAHWVNLGYVEEVVIRNHILQSLISHPQFHAHQGGALIVLFKLAGATFGTYADSSVVDRCLKLLKGQYSYNSAISGQVQVRAPRIVKGNHRAQTNFQEVFDLRERGWEGLPPPPVFAAGGPRSAGVDQGGPVATHVTTSLGLPNRDLEPQIPQPLRSESITAPGIPTTPAPPATQSPSISIATLSDFMTADSSDDELPADPTVAAPHETFYLDDGNVEVLCRNSLFRVHTSTLSFHSPTFRRMFTQTSLATAELPNGCPRILSSDMPEDFATLLKMIYLPGFVVVPAHR